MQTEQGIEEIISRNNAVVDKHFEYEAAGKVADVLSLYSSEGTKWRSRTRNFELDSLGAIEANYDDIFSGIDKAKFETKFRIVTLTTVFDYSILTFVATKEGHFSGTKKGDRGEIHLFHRFEINEKGEITLEEVDEMLAGQVYEQLQLNGLATLVRATALSERELYRQL